MGFSRDIPSPASFLDPHQPLTVRVKMLNIKISIKEQEGKTALDIVSTHFSFDFVYDTPGQAALGALEFLSDFGVLREFDLDAEAMEDTGEKLSTRKTRDLIGLQEVLEILGVSYASVHGYTAKGIFPEHKEKIGNKKYWLEADILNFKVAKAEGTLVAKSNISPILAAIKEIVPADLEEETEDEGGEDEVLLDIGEEDAEIDDVIKQAIHTL